MSTSRAVKVVCMNIMIKYTLQFVTLSVLAFIVWPFMVLLAKIPTLSETTFSLETLFQSLKVTLVSSGLSIALIVVIGTIAGYGIYRMHTRYQKIAMQLLDLPLLLPPAMTGLLLLYAYGQQSSVGQWLSNNGLSMSFSINGVVLVFLFVALPIYLKGVVQTFVQFDDDYLITARLLGESEWNIFKKVTLPLVSRPLCFNATLAFSRGIAEFGATMIVAGNLVGVTQTMPLAIYQTLEQNPNEAIVLSLVLLIFALFLSRLMSHQLKKEAFYV